MEDELAALEAQVADQQAELAEHEQLLRSISHDLRSPIGAILNYAAILEEDYGSSIDEAGAHMLRRIRSSAGRAMDLMEGLLDLSRASRCDLVFEPISSEKLVGELAARVVDPAVGCEVGPLPDVIADREQFTRAWRELLTNASRHCGAEPDPAISIRASEQDGTIAFEVADNGSGFDMRFAGKLFRPFEQLHPRSEGTGVGVGLALVATIARRHGGRVAARGTPGEGAVFTFSLAREPVR